MVITETENHFLFFEQHEHAKVCGELSEAWRDDYYLGEDKRQSVTYAIYEHDNGWIDLDQFPLVDQKRKIPYSFFDYPLKPKLKAYTNGINRIEKQDHYAALICSLHYASFFESYTNGRGEDFLALERHRQKQLRKSLKLTKEDDQAIDFHYRLLQFCDNLSLYLCMNKPGVNKENELFWFRRGFPQKFQFNNFKRMIAYWQDDQTVSLKDFPFNKALTVVLGYKSIKKSRINFLQDEYENQEQKQRTVTIVPG